MSSQNPESTSSISSTRGAATAETVEQEGEAADAPTTIADADANELALRAWNALAGDDAFGVQILHGRCAPGDLPLDEALLDPHAWTWSWRESNAAALALFEPDPETRADPASLRGRPVRATYPESASLLERLPATLAGEQPATFELRVPVAERARSGTSGDDEEEAAWFHITVVPVPPASDEDPLERTALLISRSITEYKSLLRQAVDLMNHDDLTGLANRRLLKARYWIRRRREEPLTLLFFDLNGFKAINDTHGHEVGDRVLEITAQRLERNTRPDESVARIGGDEFAVLLGVDDVDAVRRVVRRLERALSAPIHLDDLRVRIDAAVGIARHPLDGATFEALMSTADERMYRDKRRAP